MADVPVPSLARAREQKINELSDAFRERRSVARGSRAADRAGVQGGERRRARDDHRRSERAGGGAGATPCGPNVVPGDGGANVPRRTSSRRARDCSSLMSSTRRVGRWACRRSWTWSAIMSDTKLDLTHAVLPPGIIGHRDARGDGVAQAHRSAGRARDGRHALGDGERPKPRRRIRRRRAAERRARRSFGSPASRSWRT